MALMNESSSRYLAKGGKKDKGTRKDSALLFVPFDRPERRKGKKRETRNEKLETRNEKRERSAHFSPSSPTFALVSKFLLHLTNSGSGAKGFKLLAVDLTASVVFSAAFLTASMADPVFVCEPDEEEDEEEEGPASSHWTGFENAVEGREMGIKSGTW